MGKPIEVFYDRILTTVRQDRQGRGRRKEGRSMTLRNVLLALAGVSAIVHVTSYIMIMVDLDRRGYKTNILLARIFFGRYLKAYKEATVEESGEAGPTL